MHDPFGKNEIENLIFDSLSRMGVTIITDSKDHIIAVSDHYTKILNLKRKDILGRHVSDVF